MRFAVSLAATLLPAALCAQNLTPDQQLARDIYKELIEINTADSVGNTTLAANAVAKRMLAAGFPEADIFQGGPRPDKGNVVVRYRGTGARKPMMLLAHLDVVQALKSDWSSDLDPFKFTERDGYYYGRGTADDKAMASIFIANLIRFKKEGYVPDRDIILVLTADEEGGGSNGVRWLLQNHRDKIDAEFALNEGGGGSLRDGKPFINAVGAAEKVSANFTVTASNRGGHSSVPRDDNAIYDLSAALSKIGAYPVPGRVESGDEGVFRAHGENRDARSRRGDARGGCEPERPGGRRDRIARSTLPFDAAHVVRRDDAVGRPRAQRTAADRDGEHQLPHGARPQSRGRARGFDEGDR